METYKEEIATNGSGKKLKRGIRKLKKPLIEKKRRDRINRSLLHLKTLLLENIRRNGGTQTAKLDKADILEMTVNYMMMLQYGQTVVTMVNKHRYNYGYQTCAREAIRIPGDSIDCSSGHLPTRLQNRTYIQTANDIFQPDMSADNITRKQMPIQIAIPEMPLLTSTPKPATIGGNHTVNMESQIAEENSQFGNLIKLEDSTEPLYETEANNDDLSSVETEASESRNSHVSYTCTSTTDIDDLKHSENFSSFILDNSDNTARTCCYKINEARVWRPW